MKRLIYFCLAIAFASGVVSCSKKGVTFGKSPVNTPLPESFKIRAVYPAGVAGYEFQDLVGLIIHTQKNASPMPVGLIRPDNFIPKVIPITDPLNYYRSRIQKGAEAQGSYLSFAAKFSAEQMAEIELVDVARAGIVFRTPTTFDSIAAKAKVWVDAHPKTDTSITRLWIQAVVLTRHTYSDFTKINADASGQVGPVVGVKTGVYNNTENLTKSVSLGFIAFDIDKLVANARELESITGQAETILRFSTNNKEIQGVIQPDGDVLKRRP
mgnify:CR=1 FL=1